MSVSLESLFELAQALDVPPAFLLSTTEAMASAILSLGLESESQQKKLAEVLAALTELPVKQREDLIKRLLPGSMGR